MKKKKKLFDNLNTSVVSDNKNEIKPLFTNKGFLGIYIKFSEKKILEDDTAIAEELTLISQTKSLIMW